MDKRLDKYLQTVEMELHGLREERRESELREMRQHLEAIVARLTEGGLSREEAIEAAIAQFGAARTVGRELEKASAPHEPWWRTLLAPVCGIACGYALRSLFGPALYALGSTPAPGAHASTPLVLALLWLFTLLSGVVAGYLSPRWGGRLLLGLKMVQVAMLTVFSPAPPAVVWQQLLLMLVSNCTSIPLGAYLGGRLARKRQDARASGPTEVA